MWLIIEITMLWCMHKSIWLYQLKSHVKYEPRTWPMYCIHFSLKYASSYVVISNNEFLYIYFNLLYVVTTNSIILNNLQN